MYPVILLKITYKEFILLTYTFFYHQLSFRLHLVSHPCMLIPIYQIDLLTSQIFSIEIFINFTCLITHKIAYARTPLIIIYARITII